MEEERPNLENTLKVKPTTGLPEGQVGLVLEKPGFGARVRRVLSNIAKKLDTNPNNIPPSGKAF